MREYTKYAAEICALDLGKNVEWHVLKRYRYAGEERVKAFVLTNINHFVYAADKNEISVYASAGAGWRDNHTIRIDSEILVRFND